MIKKIFILASNSYIRKTLLKNAGLNFIIEPAKIDEKNLQKKYNHIVNGLALVLANAKAQDVSDRNPDLWVVGCDQTVIFNNKILHKVENEEEAIYRLSSFSGKTHYLETAVTLFFKGKVIWNHVTVSKLTMHSISIEDIKYYVKNKGPQLLTSVGTYQIEGEALQFFKEIEGDYFSILGLPLVPLLNALRIYLN